MISFALHYWMIPRMFYIRKTSLGKFYEALYYQNLLRSTYYPRVNQVQYIADVILRWEMIISTALYVAEFDAGIILFN